VKNIVYLPCQLALYDAQTGHSLIAVFHDIKFQFSPGTEIPINAVISRDWTIFSKWEMGEDEEGKDYTSKTEVFLPDGSLFTSNIVSAALPVANGMAFILRLQGFPIGQTGKLKIVNTLHNGEELIYGPIETSVTVHLSFDLPIGGVIEQPIR
jgi:hypothetical protein